MSTTNAISVDTYIRSFAACLAADEFKQFIGRQKLLQLFVLDAPDSIRLNTHTFTKDEIIARLMYLLDFEGLAAELDRRTKDGQLEELIVGDTHRQKLAGMTAYYNVANKSQPLVQPIIAEIPAVCPSKRDTAITFYIRSLVAGFARTYHGQFIGRKKLIPLCSKFIHDGVTFEKYGLVSRDEIVTRLKLLLNRGLAAELDWRVKDWKK
ncbi:hypothetical protein FPQ18DRAFT_396871 [Pyronema domesticum]|nr:hypothetical protein FPQ18DRAFT_396871 [Pyronema domesticum]